MVTIGDLENNEIESIHIEGITNIPLIKGEQGEKGDKGDKGETNNIKIGTVETGEKASATLEGESPNQILNLVLPKGDKGEQGEPGIKPVKGIDYFTEEEIQKIKSNILDQVNQFSVLVVKELPTDNIDDHTIYFIPKAKTEQNDIYDEFIYINNGWEHIGTTEVDLSSYYKKDEIDAKLEAVEGNEVYIGNPAEAPSSAKIIIEDEDFVEGSTLGKAEVYVGAEEPTAGEKVWFRKVKNVFNFYNIQTKYPNAKLNTKSNNSFSITNIGNWAYALLNLNLKPNTIYTLSADVTNSNGAYCGFYIDNNIDGCKNGDKSFKSAITFTTDETGVQTVFAYVNRSATTTASTYTVTFNNVQLEQGSKATSYEAYIEPQIYVRNSNGVYEEFTKNDNVILYNNVDGSNEDITLNDNSDNYKYIDIYYRQQDGTYSFIRALPNTTVALSAPHVTDNGYAIGWAVRNIKISGNKITTATTNRYLFINVVSTNSLSGASKTNNIYITKVVGYK